MDGGSRSDGLSDDLQPRHSASGYAGRQSPRHPTGGRGDRPGEGIGDHGCEYMTGGVAMVLGSTGRNFGAGMSGGVAFVLDLDPRLVNPDMVDVLTLTPPRAKQARDLISKFVAETGSEVGTLLLRDWDSSVARISLVMPRDYARVLATMEKAEREGVDIDEAIMEAIRG